MLAQLTATWCAALLAGVAFYVTAIAPPVLVVRETGLARIGFSPNRRGGLLLQALLALIGVVAALEAWRSGDGAGWFIGALALGLAVPFTLLVMSTTSWSLREGEDPDEALGRLLRWAEIQVVRGVVCAFALMTFFISFSHR